MPKRVIPLDRLEGRWNLDGLTAVEAADRTRAYGRNDIVEAVQQSVVGAGS